MGAPSTGVSGRTGDFALCLFVLAVIPFLPPVYFYGAAPPSAAVGSRLDFFPLASLPLCYLSTPFFPALDLCRCAAHGPRFQ